MAKVILVLGGARSGKSAYAVRRAQESFPRSAAVFIATAEPKDEEMKRRIDRHRSTRPSQWLTVEAPRDLPTQVVRYSESPLILIDDITLWLSNTLEEALGRGNYPAAEQVVMQQVGALAEALKLCTGKVVIVSNEVGMGMVPLTPLGRAFQDLLGLANQRLAEIAQEVYLMWAGIPLRIKGA